MIHLSSGVFFDDTDGIGVLSDARHNRYIDLTQQQTTYLVALLAAASGEEALGRPPTSFDPPEMRALHQERERFYHTLLANDLIVDGPGPARWISNAAASNKNAYRKFTPSVAPAVTIPVWEHPSPISWEIFLTGTNRNPPLPSLTLRQRLRAATHALGVVMLFHFFARGCWLLQAQRYLQRLAPTDLQHLPPEMQQRLAQRELIRSQITMRLVSPRGRYVPRSLALCAYLRALGLSAQFVLARARYTFDTTEFHAWTEVAARPANEPDELPLGYAVFTKIP